MTKELETHLWVTPDLKLRSLTEKDASSLFQLTEINRARLKTWLPWLDQVQAEINSLTFIQELEAKRFRSEELQFGLFQHNTLCGMVGTHHINWINRNTTLGYWIGAEFEGRHFVSQACARLICYLFDKLNLHRVAIHCAVQNYRSQTIAEHLGFQREGVLHDIEWLYDHFVDHVIYAKFNRDP